MRFARGFAPGGNWPARRLKAIISRLGRSRASRLGRSSLAGARALGEARRTGETVRPPASPSLYNFFLPTSL